MRRRMIKALVVTSAFFIVAQPVMANDEFYSWTMNFRIVNAHSGPLHYMFEGDLTNRGQIWVTSRDPGHTASPWNVTYRVYHAGTEANAVCTGVITPGTQINVGKQYNFSCPFINAGNYWVQISKGIDDGWNEQGQGDLVTS